MSAVILDTELTGLVAADVIELAQVIITNLEPNQALSDPFVQRFHPREGVVMEPGAMAVHNIILDDLVNEETWTGTWELPAGIEYLIGHNVDCDWEAIGRPQVKRICTLALSRFLWPNLSTHKLSAMMYTLFAPAAAREYVKGAHGAVSDVAMTWLLLGFILDRAHAYEHLWRVPSFEALWELSEKARIPLRLTFGKWGPKDGNPGLLYSEAPRDYLQWMLRQTDMDPYVQLAARQALGA